MSDTVSSGHASPPSSDDRNLAFLVYALLFIAPFVFGFTGLVGVVISYVRRPDADPLVRSHYAFQIRVFWIAVVLGILGAIAFLFGLGTIINDVFQAVTRQGQGWDAWSVAAVEEGDFEFHASSIVGFILWMVITGVASLWLMVASIFGVARLAGGHPIGRIDR